MLSATRRPFLNFFNEVCNPDSSHTLPAGRRFEVVVQFHQIFMFHHELCEYLASASLKLLECVGFAEKSTASMVWNVHLVVKFRDEPPKMQFLARLNDVECKNSD